VLKLVTKGHQFIREFARSMAGDSDVFLSFKLLKGHGEINMPETAL